MIHIFGRMVRYRYQMVWLLFLATLNAQQFDTIVRGGTVYDGSGGAPMRVDIGIKKDRIAAIGDLKNAKAKTEIRCEGACPSPPGFINLMSGPETLFEDGRSQSDLRQGVTLEVFGEGESMGPQTPEMRKYFEGMPSDIKYPMPWSTLAEGLKTLAAHGISCNIASFVGAATIRENVLGFADRAPTAAELTRMRELTRQAMREGALGVASALIYAPGTYAKTDELIALAQEAKKSNGISICIRISAAKATASSRRWTN